MRQPSLGGTADHSALNDVPIEIHVAFALNIRYLSMLICMFAVSAEFESDPVVVVFEVAFS